MIPVTKPFLPPREEYDFLIRGIWDRTWLTNMGPLEIDLEMKLKSHLGVDHLLFVSNGTIALQFAIRALELEGEIISTPFTYVATTSSIVWEGCKPVYVDIDPKSLNIDPNKIEAAITDKTSAIIATHVYGNPCDVDAIDKIAQKHDLKVIYDAAHAFGVKVNGKSVFDYGDISTCSTHATKLFHTCEGGFVVTKNEALLKKMAYMRNFGHDGPEVFKDLGINGKNSEFHAAMGLVNLKYIKDIHKKRKLISDTYDVNLKETNLIKPLWNASSSKNYAYYPIIFKSEKELLKKNDQLIKANIYARRYFYPSLNKVLPYVNSIKNCVISEEISTRILCLPIYHELTLENINSICEILKQKL